MIVTSAVYLLTMHAVSHATTAACAATLLFVIAIVIYSNPDKVYAMCVCVPINVLRK